MKHIKSFLKKEYIKMAEYDNFIINVSEKFIHNIIKKISPSPKDIIVLKQKVSRIIDDILSMEENKIINNNTIKIKEVWLPVTGYVGLYEVSNIGRVKKLEGIGKYIRNGKIIHKLNSEKILKHKFTWDGYYESTLSDKYGKRKYIRTHILVAKAFVNNEKNKPCVNHKDCNKINNNTDNLEWVTIKENYIHARKNGLMNIAFGERSNTRLKEEDVLNIRKLRSEKHITMEMLAEKYNMSTPGIFHIINRDTWKHI